VSRHVVHEQWWCMVLLALVLVLIVCAGALVCVVGLVIAIPVASAALMYVYEDMFGPRAAVVQPMTAPESGGVTA